MKRIMITAGAFAALLAVAGCGKGDTVSSGSGGADPAGVVSTIVTNTIDPGVAVGGYDQAGDIATNPNARNAHPTALASMVPTGDSVRVTWWGGVCDQLISAKADETGDAIMLDVQLGTDPAKQVCTDQAVLTRTVIKLSAPIGDRAIVDLNANG